MAYDLDQSSVEALRIELISRNQNPHLYLYSDAVVRAIADRAQSRAVPSFRVPSHVPSLLYLAVMAAETK